jgi:cation-transporting P-type ATPase E
MIDSATAVQMSHCLTSSVVVFRIIWNGRRTVDMTSRKKDNPVVMMNVRSEKVSRENADCRSSFASIEKNMRPAAFILFAERLRPDAAETIAYFAAQGVLLKVISGDSPHTVSAVATHAGLPQAGDPVDARDLPEDPAALGALLEEHSVFGRVTPHQKQAMVKALQARGHTVAMTGDGVNDVLALKLADLGIAMGSGAPATKAVAELVLLDGRFATLPGVVAEGRRVTANIERVANLFITKTVWAALLAVAVGAALLPYPFLPGT